MSIGYPYGAIGAAATATEIQMRAQHGGSFYPQSTAYCQNCECPGCKIHRERLRVQQEAAAYFAGHLCDYEDLPLNPKPGAIVPIYKTGVAREEELGEETDGEAVADRTIPKERRRWIPWRVLAYCAVIAIGLQLVARVCGRVV